MAEKEASAVFSGNYLFPKLFRSFQMAFQPGKLTIALLALATICFAGRLMDFGGSVVCTRDAQGRLVDSELQVYLHNPDKLDSYIERFEQQDTGGGARGGRTGVFSTLWHFGTSQFHGLVNALVEFNLPAVAAGVAGYFRALAWVFKYHTIYCIIFFIIILAVTSLAGGAICRISALQFARGEKPGIFEAMRFSTKNFFNFFAAPVAPLVIISIVGVFVLLLGVVANVPIFGKAILVVFTPAALLAGTMIALVLIVTTAGFNLMFPAIAYEDTDFFDSISRSYNYVFLKPWKMGFYTVIAALYGTICYLFVRLFAFLLLLSTRGFLRLGLRADSASEQTSKLEAIWPKPEFMDLLGTPTEATLSLYERITASLIRLELMVIVGLVVAFIISFYFSANTIIYAFMRNRVDNTALEKVHTHLDEVENSSYTAEESPPEQDAQENPEQDKS